MLREITLSDAIMVLKALTPANASVKARVDYAARRSGLGHSRIRDIWYGKARQLTAADIAGLKRLEVNGSADGLGVYGGDDALRISQLEAKVSRLAQIVNALCNCADAGGLIVSNDTVSAFTRRAAVNENRRVG